MDDNFKSLIADALEISLEEVVGDLALDPEENWDSIALLSVISAIDTSYDIQLEGEELEGCSTVAEVYILVSKNLN